MAETLVLGAHSNARSLGEGLVLAQHRQAVLDQEPARPVGPWSTPI